MPSITRGLAAVAGALALSAGPALANSPTSSTGAVKAKTPLTAKIAHETPLIREEYRLNNGVDPGLERNALASDDAAIDVNRVHADSAQLPAKLEWVLGADLQRRADNTIANAQHLLVYHHSTAGKRGVDRGLSYLRLSNYFLANAASQLGVAHPRYSAEPYHGKDQPVKTSPPLIAKAPKPTLAGMVSMATPLLSQRIPEHILGAYVGFNQYVAAYYSVAVSRMHVDHSDQSAQREWVEGVRSLAHGDDLLDRGTTAIQYSGGETQATGKREIQSALATFRHANAQISHADRLLGVHQSGPTVGLASKVQYRL